jgi:hypothetical protein
MIQMRAKFPGIAAIIVSHSKKRLLHESESYL